MLIHGNPRAEQTEPRIRSARFGIGRDETEHRPTLLGRTEIETEHPLAPRDESEQYSISVRSVRSQACEWGQSVGLYLSNRGRENYIDYDTCDGQQRQDDDCSHSLYSSCK